MRQPYVPSLHLPLRSGDAYHTLAVHPAMSCSRWLSTSRMPTWICAGLGASIRTAPATRCARRSTPCWPTRSLRSGRHLLAARHNHLRSPDPCLAHLCAPGRDGRWAADRGRGHRAGDLPHASESARLLRCRRSAGRAAGYGAGGGIAWPRHRHPAWRGAALGLQPFFLLLTVWILPDTWLVS
jgi:hypothetical protein